MSNTSRSRWMVSGHHARLAQRPEPLVEFGLVAHPLARDLMDHVAAPQLRPRRGPAGARRCRSPLVRRPPRSSPQPRPRRRPAAVRQVVEDRRQKLDRHEHVERRHLAALRLLLHMQRANPHQRAIGSQQRRAVPVRMGGRHVERRFEVVFPGAGEGLARASRLAGRRACSRPPAPAEISAISDFSLRESPNGIGGRSNGSSACSTPKPVAWSMPSGCASMRRPSLLVTITSSASVIQVADGRQGSPLSLTTMALPTRSVLSVRAEIASGGMRASSASTEPSLDLHIVIVEPRHRLLFFVHFVSGKWVGHRRRLSFKPQTWRHRRPSGHRRPHLIGWS